MKRICSLFLAMLSLFAVGCSTKYRTDVPVYELANLALEGIDDSIRFVRAEQNYLDGYLPTDSLSSSREIYFAADGNRLDEFGIFYSDRPRELKDELEDYLEDTLEENRSFYDSYIPEETPKLRDAEVRSFGDCVVYAILSPEHKKELFRRIEEDLRS